jgi:Domain of unknown function (DUF4157)
VTAGTRLSQTETVAKEAVATTKRTAAAAKPLAVASVSRSLILQAKLTVGAASDPLEKEADAMADAFLAFSASPASASDSAPADEKSPAATPAPAATGAPAAEAPHAEEAKSAEPESASAAAPSAAADGVARKVARMVVRKAEPDAPSAAAFEAPAAVEDHIAATSGSGQKLPAAFQARMEAFAHVDLSSVRLHTDAASAAAADAIGAEAFATGSDIYFGSGGSPADAHLLAHEVAHVVQQMTGSLSTTAIGRETPAAAAPTSAGPATTAASAAGVTLPTVDPVAAAVTPEVGGLASGIFGMVTAIRNFMDMWNSGSQEDRLVAAHETALSAGSTAKSAINVAQAAGASIAASVLPGLDLAFALLSTIRNITHIVYLVKANREQEEAKLDAKTRGDLDLEKALGTTLAKSNRKLGLTAVQLIGDVTIAVGAVAQLATGPFGTAVKLAGALVKVGGAIAGAIYNHYEEKATKEATFNYNVAQKVGTDAEKETAKNERLSVDALFAIQEILAKSIGPDGVREPKLMNLLATYGLGPKWVSDYDAAGDKKAKMAEGEKIILRFIGGKVSGAGISDMILGGLSKAWEWIKGLFGKSDTNPTATPGEVYDEAITRVTPVVVEKLAYRSPRGAQSLSPEKFTKDLSSVYSKLLTDFVESVKDEDAADKKVKGDRIDDAFEAAIRKAAGADITGATVEIVGSSVAVIGGRISFKTTPVAPAGPAASSASAGVPAMAGAH